MLWSALATSTCQPASTAAACVRPQLSQAIASQFAAVAEHRLLLPRGTFLWDCYSVLLRTFCTQMPVLRNTQKNSGVQSCFHNDQIFFILNAGANLSPGWRGHSACPPRFGAATCLGTHVLWASFGLCSLNCQTCQAFQSSWEVHCQAVCPGQVEEGLPRSTSQIFTDGKADVVPLLDPGACRRCCPDRLCDAWEQHVRDQLSQHILLVCSQMHMASNCTCFHVHKTGCGNFEQLRTICMYYLYTPWTQAWRVAFGK